MTVNRTSEPFDEHALQMLFEQIEPPAGMEANWRNRVALAEPAKGRRAARRVRFRGWFRRITGPWARAVLAGVTALAAGGVVGVVAANRQPSPEPNPDVIETITNAPPTRSSAPSVVPPPSSGSAPANPSGGQPVPGGPATGSGTPVGQPPPANPGVPAPARGPLTEWPDAGNAGIPPGTVLSTHAGDLHVTSPGAIIADRRVTGTVYIEAPDVTLRRVLVLAPWGASGAVRQLPQAPRLRVEDSEISRGQFGVRQEAAGLTVQRSHIHDVDYAVGVTADVTIVDSFLPDTGSQVLTNGNAARLTVRHNTISGAIETTDQDGPVTDVTIENNQIDFIWAPSGSGSQRIRVTGNHFRRDRPDDVPVGGWNGQAPGNMWTGNVWSGTSEPANP